MDGQMRDRFHFWSSDVSPSSHSLCMNGRGQALAFYTTNCSAAVGMKAELLQYVLHCCFSRQ